MGERRWLAARSAGIPTLSCVVAERPASASELLGLQLIENCLREDLSDLGQAKAFRTLMDANGWSTHQLARELGIAQPNVVRAVALLKLPEPVQARVESGELSASAAYAISAIADPAEQAEVADRVVGEGLSRDQTIEVVRQAKASRPAGKGSGAKPKKVTERVIRTPDGPRVTVEFKRGLDGPAVAAALRQALELVEAELAEGQAAA